VDGSLTGKGRPDGCFMKGIDRPVSTILVDLCYRGTKSNTARICWGD